MRRGLSLHGGDKDFPISSRQFLSATFLLPPNKNFRFPCRWSLSNRELKKGLSSFAPNFFNCPTDSPSRSFHPVACRRDLSVSRLCVVIWKAFFGVERLVLFPHPLYPPYQPHRPRKPSLQMWAHSPNLLRSPLTNLCVPARPTNSPPLAIPECLPEYLNRHNCLPPGS